MLDTAGMIELYSQWSRDFPIFSIEDGMAEDDWSGWQQLTAAIGDKVQLVGDDLFVTNTERLARGIEEKSANAILIKVNQIGGRIGVRPPPGHNDAATMTRSAVLGWNLRGRRKGGAIAGQVRGE